MGPPAAALKLDRDRIDAPEQAVQTAGRMSLRASTWLALSSSTLLILVFSGQAQPGMRASAASPCLKAPASLVHSLKSGLKSNARGKLGTPFAVKSRDRYTIPRGLQAGVYYVSAPVRGFGVATWAVSASAFRTGGGLIIGTGPVARRVSVLGIDIPASTLRLWGLRETANGYAPSRRCVT